MYSCFQQIHLNSNKLSYGSIGLCLYNILCVWRIIIITHSDRALFDLNALVSSLGGIVPLLGLHSGI